MQKNLIAEERDDVEVYLFVLALAKWATVEQILKRMYSALHCSGHSCNKYQLYYNYTKAKTGSEK